MVVEPPVDIWNTRVVEEGDACAKRHARFCAAGEVCAASERIVADRRVHGERVAVEPSKVADDRLMPRAGVRVKEEACQVTTGKGSIGTRRVDVNKGGRGNPDHRSSLVAQQVTYNFTESTVKTRTRGQGRRWQEPC